MILDSVCAQTLEFTPFDYLSSYAHLVCVDGGKSLILNKPDLLPRTSTGLLTSWLVVCYLVSLALQLCN